MIKEQDSTLIHFLF